MATKKTKVFLKVTFLLCISLLTAAAFANVSKRAAKSKRGKSASMERLSTMPIKIKGKYKKHDKEFIYLQSEGTKSLIKVNRKFIDNSPSFLSDGEVVLAQMPLGYYLLDNYKPKNATK